MQRDNRFPDLERRYEQHLPRRGYGVVRVDGNNFSSFTRQFERPFSQPFATAMNAVAQRLVEFFSGALFAYVQSDEVSIVFSDLHSENFQYPFSGRILKLTSLAAANATAAFMRTIPNTTGLPLFDGRAFALETFQDVANYLHYRRLDARKNAVTMAASTLRSERELLGMNTPARIDLLASSGFGLIPDGFMNGRIVHPIERAVQVTVPNSDAGLVVNRRVWVTVDATLAVSETILHAAATKLAVTYVGLKPVPQ